PVHPGPKVCSGCKRAETLERLHVRFLNQVLCLVAVACEPVREVIQRRKQGHSKRFKRLGVPAIVMHVLDTITRRLRKYSTLCCGKNRRGLRGRTRMRTQIRLNPQLRIW